MNLPGSDAVAVCRKRHFARARRVAENAFGVAGSPKTDRSRSSASDSPMCPRTDGAVIISSGRCRRGDQGAASLFLLAIGLVFVALPRRRCPSLRAVSKWRGQAVAGIYLLSFPGRDRGPVTSVERFRTATKLVQQGAGACVRVQLVGQGRCAEVGGLVSVACSVPGVGRQRVPRRRLRGRGRRPDPRRHRPDRGPNDPLGVPGRPGHSCWLPCSCW